MKLHLPKNWALAVMATFAAVMVQSAHGDVVTTTYVSTTNGRGTADAAMQKQDGSGTEGADSFNKTMSMTAFTQSTNLVLSGNGQGTISNVSDNGGWGGRIAFSGQSDYVVDITINQGIEADVTNIQSQTALTVHADNASFYGSGNPYAFNMAIGENGVRMNGGSSNSYTLSGTLTGSGNLNSCTGNDSTSLTVTGNLSNYTGSFVGISDGGKKREIIFGNGGSASDVTGGVVGAGVGTASAVTRSVKFNYTGDLVVKGGLYATTVTAQNLDKLTLSGGGTVGTLNMGSTKLVNTDNLSVTTLSGASIDNTGTLTVAHLTVADGASVSNTGSMTLAGTVVSSGTLSLSGNFTVDTATLGNFEIKDEGGVTWSDAANEQGFKDMTGAVYYAVKGTVAEGAFSLGENVTRAEDNSGLVFSVGASSGTQYYVNKSAATLTVADTTKATAYSIAQDSAEITVTGGTFDNSLLQSGDRAKLTSLVLSGGDAILKNNRAFSGNVTINEGSTLTIGTTDALVYSGTSDSKTITVNAGGTLDFGSNRLSLGNEAGGNAVYNIIINGGTITGNGDASRALHFFDSSKITATGTTGVISATTRIRDAADTLTVEVTGADDQLLMSGLVDGGGILKKTGAGTLKVTGTNKTNGGGTVVEAGTLLVSSGGQSGALAGTLTVKEGAKVTLEAGDALGWGTSQHVSVLNLEGGNLHVTTTGQANQTFANTALNLKGGTITGKEGSNIDLFNGSSTVHAMAADTATAEAPTVSTVSGVTLSLREASTTFTVDTNAKLVLESGLKNGNKSESFANALVVEGAGTLEMKGAGTYQGGTTLNGGTLSVQHASALGTGAVSVADGATLLVGAADTTVTSLSLAAGSVFDFGEGGSLSVGTLNIGGAITLGENLTASLESLSGTDTLTLFSGVSTFNYNGSAYTETTSIDSIFSGLSSETYQLSYTGNVLSIGLVQSSGNDYVVGETTAPGTYDNLVFAAGTTEGNVSGAVVVTGNIEIPEDDYLNLPTAGDSVTHDGVTVSGIANNESALVGTEDDYVVVSATVSVAEPAVGEKVEKVEYTHAVYDSAVENNTTQPVDLVLAGEENEVTSIKAITGKVTIMNMGEEAITLTNLEIAEGQTVAAYVAAATGEANEATLVIGEGQTATFAASSTLLANLVVEGGATVNSDGALTMGSTVTLKAGETLNITATGVDLDAAAYVIYTDVESLILESISTEPVAEGWYDADKVYSLVKLGSTELDAAALANYTIGYWNKSVSIVNKNVPEPTTSVLSLLALAGLAGRRRRR